MLQRRVRNPKRDDCLSLSCRSFFDDLDWLLTCRERPDFAPERGRFASRSRGMREGRDPDRLRSFGVLFFVTR